MWPYRDCFPFSGAHCLSDSSFLSLGNKKFADPVVHSKRGESSTCNNNSCSGNWPHLGSSRGSRSSIAAQEDAKNVASGADRAAERAEAQGRPGTGTCAPNRDMRPELDRLSRSKNQPYHNQPLGTSSVDESDVGRKGGSVCGDKK